MTIEQSEVNARNQNQNALYAEARRKMHIRLIVRGLKSDNPAVAKRALTTVQELLTKEATFAPSDVDLLFEVQKEIDPLVGSEYALLNQVYDLILDKVFDCWTEASAIPALIAWYEHQTNYDGVVSAKLRQLDHQQWQADIFPTADALRSDDPERIKTGLREADWWFFYDPRYIGEPPLPVLLALEALIEKKAIFGDEIFNQARDTLMGALSANRRLLDLDDKDISRLVAWYHQQEDCEPFD